MPILQISAAKGPAECEQAVKYTLDEILKDAKKHQTEIEILDQSITKHGFSTVLLEIKKDNHWLNT